MKRNQEYWTAAEHKALLTARSFSDLVTIAVRVLNRMPKPISQVCGPISTGGLGNIAENLKVFEAALGYLISQGVTVFDPMPFENHFFHLLERGQGSRNNNQLLTEFYLPIFNSRLISRLYFIHGWETSEGATWEHGLSQRLRLEINYLPQDFMVKGEPTIPPPES